MSLALYPSRVRSSEVLGRSSALTVNLVFIEVEAKTLFKVLSDLQCVGS